MDISALYGDELEQVPDSPMSLTGADGCSDDGLGFEDVGPMARDEDVREQLAAEAVVDEEEGPVPPLNMAPPPAPARVPRQLAFESSHDDIEAYLKEYYPSLACLLPADVTASDLFGAVDPKTKKDLSRFFDARLDLGLDITS